MIIQGYMLNIKFIISKGLKRILNPPALRNTMIDSTSKVCSGSELSSVSINKYSYVGNRCFIVNASIGSFCSIADKCSIGGAAHPITRVSSSPVFHNGENIMKKNFAKFEPIKTPRTVIENDVWIGMGVYLKAGVTIHNGAVIGMGSVVTKDIPPYEIWAGNPARKIGTRFTQETIDKLLGSEWWSWDDNKLQDLAHTFDDIESFFKASKDLK